MKSFFVEGYGCSLNIGETEQIAGFLRRNGFAFEPDFKKADFVIINTCSVKQATEQRMISRIKSLLGQKKSSASLIVFGCLASAQKELIAKISDELIVADTSLASLCRALKIKEQNFSPKIIPAKSKKFISILPISTGCLGACTYCSAHLARKELHSHSAESILSGMKSALSLGSKEIWLTSQDLGCYGCDIGSSLPELLRELLKVEGDYRIRLGMMNPNHFKKIRKEMALLFRDERLYKFLHLPVQSGSDKILHAMNRKYSVKEFVECVSFARKNIPNVTISTDIIVGFPGENRADFAKTIAVLKKVKPNVVNISRFGKRKGTPAEKMPLQVLELEKKARSKTLAELCDSISLAQNKKLVGKKMVCLVSEEAKGGFNARTNEYRPVFVKKGFGDFAEIEIIEAKPHFFNGVVLEAPKK
ncbi:tRNA-2-methylthio-N(6)-dimethylallyladenosine synthase [uncultured archaeon]|nr:tRNA-2-methylthio-N(6)-dimethylallyladenosine synthase [uncultured archaeon]